MCVGISCTTNKVLYDNARAFLDSHMKSWRTNAPCLPTLLSQQHWWVVGTHPTRVGAIRVHKPAAVEVVRIFGVRRGA